MTVRYGGSPDLSFSQCPTGGEYKIYFSTTRWHRYRLYIRVFCFSVTSWLAAKRKEVTKDYNLLLKKLVYLIN